MKKLLLIDGMAAVYRGYYALSRTPRLNSKGLNTSAALGFANGLLDLIRSQQPTHMAVAFDLPAPTFRHEIYPEYKAHRDPMPEEILSNLPWIRRIIDALRIPQLTAEGFEADDVIGTIAHAAELGGFDRILIVTPDKDLAQLVTSHIAIYRHGRGKTPDSILGVPEVCEHFGVDSPCQVIDLLGLWGDTADNIPGVQGVGEKTAQKLIHQFGSVENLVAHVDDVPNDRIREKIRANADDALFSKKLATIRLDAPVPFEPDTLLLQKPDFQQLAEICETLEFRQLPKRIANVFSLPVTPTLNQSDTQPTRQSENTLFSYVNPALKQTDTQPITQSALVGRDVAIIVDGPKISIAPDADTLFSASVADIDLPMLRRILADDTTTKLVFDLKSLRYFLAELDAPLRGNIFDVQLAHYLLDPELPHTLDSVCGATEPTALWLQYPVFSARMRDAGLERLYSDVELPLVDVLIDMESAGIRIDTQALNDYAAQLSAQRDDIERQITELAGHPLNINSPRQLGQLLYEELRVTDKPPLTATKQYSTAEETLRSLASSHPVIPLILNYRTLSKLVSTYLDTLPKLISPVDHRLHTVYNQTVTATGRLSSSNPNLQNIPIRTDLGREIRRAFVPADSDHLILAADYSQIELRIIASLSQDTNLLEAFNNHQDIHAATAARIGGIPIGEVTPDQRRAAKTVNFGIVYGISAFGLSQQLGIPRKEAAALIDNYLASHPAMAEYIEQSKQFARTHGYARTLLGRRRYLPDINSRNAAARSFAERNAVNMPIQGTSADMIKIAMIRIHDEIGRLGLRSRLLLQVHDELVFDLYRPEEEVLKELVTRHMRDALPLQGLPVEVSVGIADNWLDAH